MFTSWRKEREKESFNDFKFEDLKIEGYSKNFEDSFKMKFKFLLQRFNTFKYFYDYIADILVVISYYSAGTDFYTSLASAYLGFTILSFLIGFNDIRKSKKIIEKADVSDAFTNILSWRYWTAKDFDHFCFLTELTQSTKLLDKVSLTIVLSADSFFQIWLVDLPQFIIGIIGSVNADVTAFSLLMFILKTLLLYVSLYRGTVAFFLYGWFRCLLGPPEEYTSHRYDRIINQFVALHKLEKKNTSPHPQAKEKDIDPEVPVELQNLPQDIPGS